MSSEVTQQQNSFGSALIFPAITTTGGALISAKANGGIRKALDAQNKEGFKALNETLKGQTDTFTRAQALSETYDNYKKISRTSARSERQLARLNSGKDASFLQKIANIFKKKDEKISLSNKDNAVKILDGNIKKLEDANKAIDDTAKCLKNGASKIDDLIKPERISLKSVANNASEAVETGFKASAKNFGKTALGNFKHELSWKSGKFNYFMTALQFIPNVIQKVVPAFKNNGFKAGMKELGQTLIQGGADLVSYAAGGALGRVIGTAIGTIICPGAGSAIGGNIGDMIGSVIVGSSVCGTIEKAVNKDDAENINAENAPQAQLSTTGNNLNIVENSPEAQSALAQQSQTAQTPKSERWLTYEEVARIEQGAQELKANSRAKAFAKTPYGAHSNLNSYLA